MVDCIVVGAGVAGGSAAYHLAKRGHAVLVLEKGQNPRPKVCSGAVSPAVAAWFDFDFAPVVTRRVNRVCLTWQMGDPINLTLDTPMWMVERTDFDKFLLDQALAQGCQLQSSTVVTGLARRCDRWLVETDQGQFSSSYLIVADGAGGSLSKLLKLKDKKVRHSYALESPAMGADDHIYFDFGSLSNGYIWNFPKVGGRSLGVSTFRGGDPRPEDLSKYASRFGLDESQLSTATTCIWDGNQTLHNDYALVAGEAAGLVDPLIGEGIRPGMYSGVEAAVAVSRALGGDHTAMAQYSQTIHKNLGEDMALGQKLAGLFYQFPKIAYKAGLKRPAIGQVMSMLLVGEISYTGIFDIAVQRLKASMFGGGS